MKKIFLFAIAAVTMTVGCQKLQEIINPNHQHQIDDDSPVAIEFTTNVASVETRVKTKAEGSVTVLGDAHTLYIYGINSATGAPKSIYNKEAKTSVKEGNGSAALEWADGSTQFYNGTTDTYDFYGYYVDDATVTTAFSETNFQSEITITGQQDILLAKANKTTDVAGKTDKSGTPIDADDAYSAMTARAGVKPNLNFEHQLTQFTFAVRNLGTSKIYLKSVALNTVDKGTLTVIDDTDNSLTQGLTALTGTAVDLTLPMDQVELAANSNDYTNVGTYFGSSFTRTSVMAFPEQTYKAVLYLSQDGMEAGKARKVTVPVTVTDGAKKGTSYELKITVYSLEEVQITASLTPWVDGAPQEIDTEDVTGGTDEEVTFPEGLSAKMVGNTANSITYEVNIPEGFTGTDIQAAYSENGTAPETGWVPVTTKSLGEVTFTGLDAAKTYYCHLKYKASAEATEYTPVAVDEATAAKPFSMKVKGVAKDEDTYTSLLPRWYQTQYGNYEEHIAGKDNPGFTGLPWFVIECAPAPKVEITVKKGDGEAQNVTFNGVASKNGLITIAESEIEGGFDIEAGTYTISINEASETFELDADLAIVE